MTEIRDRRKLAAATPLEAGKQATDFQPFLPFLRPKDACFSDSWHLIPEL
jgi:hypothetical protein